MNEWNSARQSRTSRFARQGNQTRNGSSHGSESGTALDRVEKVVKLVPAVSVAYGSLVCFAYFFGAIHFFPTGMNISDTLLLVFIAFGYGLSSAVFSALGFLLVMPAQAYVDGRLQGSRGNVPVAAADSFLLWAGTGVAGPLLVAAIVYLSVGNEVDRSGKELFASLSLTAAVAVTLGILFVWIAWFHGTRDARKEAPPHPSLRAPSSKSGPNRWASLAARAFQVFLYAMVTTGASVVLLRFGVPGFFGVFMAGCAGFLLALTMLPLQSSAPKVRNAKSSALVLAAFVAIAAAVLPLVWDSSQAKFGLANKVFETLGLRAMHATVRLSGASYRDVTELAKDSQLQIRVCKSEDGSAQVGPVNMLWHGLGTRSLMELSDGVQLQVPADQVNVIRGAIAMCHDLTTTINFASGSTAPVDSDQLTTLIAETRAHLHPSKGQQVDDWIPRRIVITGFADSMPLSDAGNEALARHRAAYVAAQLTSDPVIRESLMTAGIAAEIVSEGSRQPTRSDCKMTGPHEALAECHAADRRATVRLVFGPPALKPRAEGTLDRR
jgi:outer membrane protein OmpA-like peptidoglycan-associated protein